LVALEKRKILQTDITHGSYETILAEILDLGRSREPCYICVADVHMVVEAFWDKSFNHVVNSSVITTPDGKPLSVFMNLLYDTRQERVAGPDLMIDILRKASEESLLIYFYGSTWEVLNAISDRLKREYPSLKIAGMISPPFRPLTEEEDEEIIKTINQSGANLVLVALGCPKQEKWMYEHQGKIKATMVGVGAAFPFLAGQLKRAPKWIRDFCLEWAFRLMMEPRRLFKRYFVTNTVFLLMITRQLLYQKLFQSGFSKV
jgi:N-acetylglucosaminyldiphosphoundecaprenol N-acetyl-beta-D-mannosaminyltransferase